MAVLMLQYGGAEADLFRLLEAYAAGAGDESPLPWSEALPETEEVRLRSDLAVVLAEPAATGEGLDWDEVEEILAEYAALCDWNGPLVAAGTAPAGTGIYTVDVRSQDLRGLDRASSAVQEVARTVLTRFLPQHPTSAERLERGQLKRLPDRDLWQIDLPDGYRLRFLVDEPGARVHVVYLGPHPDGEVRGREQVLRAARNRIALRRITPSSRGWRSGLKLLLCRDFVARVRIRAGTRREGQGLRPNPLHNPVRPADAPRVGCG